MLKSATSLSSRALTVLGVLTASRAVGAASLLVSHYDGNVYSLSFDAADGSMETTSQIRAGPAMPSWLTVDKAAKTVYVTDEAWWGSPVLTSFSIQADGSLEALATARPNGGELHSALFGGEDGEGYIAMAEHDPSMISTYALPLTSSSTPLQVLEFTMNTPGPHQRQDAPHPHAVNPDPTNTHLLACDLGANLVRIFSVSPSTGELSECPSVSAAEPGAGPRHLAFSDTGNWMYTVNELGNTLSKFEVLYPIEGGCMTLAHIETVDLLDGPCSGECKAAEVHVRDGYVYVANRNDQAFGQGRDSLVVFYDPGTEGDLELVQRVDTGAWYPRTFDINKAGDLVAVGGQTSSNVVVLTRDGETGMIGDVVGEIDVGGKGSAGQEDGMSAVVWVEE